MGEQTVSIQENILAERYYAPGEKSWEDIAARVGKFIGGTAITTAMIEKKFIPASPFLMNAGTEHPQMFSCFVLPLEDSLDSIFGFYDKSSKIFKSSGGVGANWSKLRPVGSPLSGGGTTSGVVSFMEIFNVVIEKVKQGGKKKGAAICTLDISHPEVEDFIRMKLERGKFENFNISPTVTDEFMRKAIAGHEKEKALFDLIVDCTYNSSEPGMLWIDTANRYCSTPGLGLYRSTNPCITGDSLILTSKGYIPIIECIDKEVVIWNGYSWSLAKPYKTSDLESLLEIKFSNGSSVKCTPYHKFVTRKGYSRDGKEVRKKACDLRVGDKISKFSYPVIEGDLALHYAYTQGFYSGDGYFSSARNCCATYLYGEKINLLRYFDGVKSSNFEPNSNRMFVEFSPLKHKEFVPDNEYTIKSRVQWLSGLIDADGNKNCKEGCIQITSVNEQFLHAVRRMINTLGVSCRVSLMKPEDIKLMPDGNGGHANYHCQDCYRLTLSPVSVQNLIGLGLDLKRVQVSPNPNRDAAQFITVTSITDLEIKEPVYCLTEPENNTFVVDGIITGNCGERFLFPYECCCLGGINLAYFVRDGHVDWQNLGKTVRLIIRFLDEAFDRNEYPLPEIETASKNTRRIGLYPIGLADALIKMKLSYASQEGRDFTEKIWEFINKTAWDESVKLGEKLGTFPAYETRNPEIVPDGARNAAVTCVAPGGTTSLIAGINFGIEPYVGLVTKREQGSGTGTIVCPLFEEELRKVVSTEIEFNEVLDHAAKNGSIQSIEWLPEDFRRIFVTSQDIHWRDHIDMQAIFQKHCVDGTISKTINLPKSSTKEDIRDAYVYAWQQELRGLTFYREGTRDPVYAFGSGEEDEMVSVLGPGYEIPAKAPAIRYNVKVGCGKMAVFVVGDPNTGEPIELWQIPVSGGGCASLNSGNGRAISKALQYGMPPEVFIKSGEHVTCPACAGKPKLDGKSCPSAAARKLREYLNDSKIVRSYLKAHHDGSGLLVPKPKDRPIKKNECPACGWPLVYAEGCATCPKCGYSKCG